jgi:hypothetical protein
MDIRAAANPSPPLVPVVVPPLVAAPNERELRDRNRAMLALLERWKAEDASDPNADEVAERLEQNLQRNRVRFGEADLECH